MKQPKKVKKKSKRQENDEKRFATFLGICEEELRSLLDEYGLTKARVVDPGGYMYYTIIFQNETSALRVYFEWRDVYLSLQICRLVNGEVQEGLQPFNLEWTSFAVEDLLTVRAPDYDQAPLLVSRSSEDFKGETAILEEVRRELKIYAAALSAYGRDILEGDFTIFPQLDKLAKQKVKKRMTEIQEIERRREMETLSQNKAAYDLAIADNPDNPLLYFGLASTHFQSAQFSEAMAECSKVIAPDPNTAEAYSNNASTYVELGQTELALENCNKALALNPDDSVTLILRGDIHASMGNHAAALADFDRAIALDPADAMAYSNRGAIHSKLGDVQRAIEDYGMAIEWNPHYANSYANRAFAYYKVGEYEKGIADCEKALALRPDHAATYSNRGLCRASLGDVEGAAADFRRALELPCPPVVREEALTGLRTLGLNTDQI